MQQLEDYLYGAEPRRYEECEYLHKKYKRFGEAMGYLNDETIAEFPEADSYDKIDIRAQAKQILKEMYK